MTEIEQARAVSETLRGLVEGMRRTDAIMAGWCDRAHAISLQINALLAEHAKMAPMLQRVTGSIVEVLRRSKEVLDRLERGYTINGDDDDPADSWKQGGAE